MEDVPESRGGVQHGKARVRQGRVREAGSLTACKTGRRLLLITAYLLSVLQRPPAIERSLSVSYYPIFHQPAKPTLPLLSTPATPPLLSSLRLISPTHTHTFKYAGQEETRALKCKVNANTHTHTDPLSLISLARALTSSSLCFASGGHVRQCVLFVCGSDSAQSVSHF